MGQPGRMNITTLSVGLSKREARAIDSLQRISGARSRADVVRMALRRFCDRFGYVGYQFESSLFKTYRRQRAHAPLPAKPVGAKRNHV